MNVADPGHRWTRLEQLRFATATAIRSARRARRTTTPTPATSCSARSSSGSPASRSPTAVRRLVGFRRLGLDHTYWETLEATPPDARPRAHQYYDTFDNIVLDASHDLYGGGGLVSTVSDLTRFYRALFHGKIFHDARTLRTMTRVVGPGRAEGAAMGIFAGVDVDGERCFGHPGYWGTETIHCPDLDLTFARTTNQADDETSTRARSSGSSPTSPATRGREVTDGDPGRLRMTARSRRARSSWGPVSEPGCTYPGPIHPGRSHVRREPDPASTTKLRCVTAPRLHHR